MATSYSILIIIIQFCILLNRIEVGASTLSTAYPQIEEFCFKSTDPDRTVFHFQPAKNWLNDPNGPMYYNGVYHLFYQHNPSGPLWDIGNLSWGHSVSTDLVNWEALDLALNPTKSADINGCWSGSTTFLSDGEPVILYTGIDSEKKQVQNIAFPTNASDPLLRGWSKPSYNPIMLPGSDLNPTKFRDPTTGWLSRDGYWRITIAAQVAGIGQMLLYRSKNFIDWERAETPLHSSESSGMWECPDFFPVSMTGKEGLDPSVNTGNIKHVLKMSLMKTLGDYYLIGSYDEERDLFVTEEGYKDDYQLWPRIDYGNIYASKSFFDAKRNRRVVWAWSNESDSQKDDVKKGWSGIQIFPRAVWLDRNGKQLIQWPIQEIQTLRTKQVYLHDFELNTGELHEVTGILTSQADVELVFELPSLDGAETFDPSWILDPAKLCSEAGPFAKEGGIGPFGLYVLASQGLEENTAIFFRIYKHSHNYMVLMCSDLSRSSTRTGVYKPAYGGFVGVDISKNRRISLRTLIDHSVIESFGGGGRTCITARVYPKHVFTSKSHLFVFNNGSNTVKIVELTAFEMANARVNIENDSLVTSNYI